MTDGRAVTVQTQETVMEPNEVSFWAKFKAMLAGLAGKGVAIEEKVVTFDKDFIMKVLPHRGRWLLIDRVELTEEKAVGFFLVTRELCEGHGVGGDDVLPACLLPEFANQFSGIWYATQHPELIGTGKIIFARSGEYEEGKDINPEDEVERFRKGKYKASGYIRPGDLLRIEVDYANLSGSMTTNRRGTFGAITGKNFLFKVGDDLKGSVELIELKSVESPKMTPKT